MLSKPGRSVGIPCSADGEPSSSLTLKPDGRLATGLCPGAWRLGGFSGRLRLSIGDNSSVLICEEPRKVLSTLSAFLPFHFSHHETLCQGKRGAGRGGSWRELVDLLRLPTSHMKGRTILKIGRGGAEARGRACEEEASAM